MFVRRDWVAAARSYAKAYGSGATTQVAENNGDYGFFFHCVGNIQKAVEIYRIARRANPLAPSTLLQLGLDTLGRADEAWVEYRREIDLPGVHELAEWFAVLRTLAQGDPARIKAQLARYLAIQASTYLPFLAELLKVLDDRAAALDLVRRGFEDPVCQDGSRMAGVAFWAGYLGDQDLAVAAVRRGQVEMRSVGVANIWHPVLSAARKTEGFKAIARDLGLVDYWRKTGDWGDFARPLGDSDFEIIR
jgi:hypothetical protein